MTNCFTALHKRPKTIYNLTYVDWNEEVSKWRPPKPRFYTQHQPLWPLPPIKRFRPMPQPKDGEPEPDRKKVHDCRGLKTPEPSFHLGYKHFHTDPSTKKLRQLDAEKPLPYPLITEFREQYQNPNHLPHLLLELSTTRFGLPADRQKPAIGIAPRTISIPYPDMDDDPTWQRDCNSYP